MSKQTPGNDIMTKERSMMQGSGLLSVSGI
jgi:hypothetical protein